MSPSRSRYLRGWYLRHLKMYRREWSIDRTQYLRLRKLIDRNKLDEVDEILNSIDDELIEIQTLLD